MASEGRGRSFNLSGTASVAGSTFTASPVVLLHPTHLYPTLSPSSRQALEDRLRALDSFLGDYLQRQRSRRPGEAGLGDALSAGGWYWAVAGLMTCFCHASLPNVANKCTLR